MKTNNAITFMSYLNESVQFDLNLVLKLEGKMEKISFVDDLSLYPKNRRENNNLDIKALITLF